MVAETDTTNPNLTKKSELLARSAMTPIERLHGRFMRAPDHDAGTGGGSDGGDAGAGADQGADEGAAGDQGQNGSDPGDEDNGAATDDGSGQDTILGGDADEGDGSGDGDEAQGAASEVPETYELTPPEGFEALDQETVDEATPVFKELGLTNEQANQLMPIAGKFAKRIQDQAQQQIMDSVTQQRADWAKEAQDDPDIGGAKFAETKELAAKALDALGYPKGSKFRSFLTDSGLGNHPEMIRAMRKIGEMVSESGEFIHGDAGAQIKPGRLEALYPNDVPKEGAN